MIKRKMWAVFRRWRDLRLKEKKGWHLVFTTDDEQDADVVGDDHEFAEYAVCEFTVELPR